MHSSAGMCYVYLQFVSNDVMKIQLFLEDCECPCDEEHEMPLYCRLSLLAMVPIVVCVHWKARILKASYGCAAPENASVADVCYEYSSGGLDRMTGSEVIGHIIERMLS